MRVCLPTVVPRVRPIVRVKSAVQMVVGALVVRVKLGRLVPLVNASVRPIARVKSAVPMAAVAFAVSVPKTSLAATIMPACAKAVARARLVATTVAACLAAHVPMV